MPPLGMPTPGTMMETELDMPEDCSKLRNINLETTHRTDNTIGKKSKYVMNAKLSTTQLTTIREVGLQFKTESYTELDGGFLQTAPHPPTLFGNKLEPVMEAALDQLMFTDVPLPPP